MHGVLLKRVHLCFLFLELAIRKVLKGEYSKSNKTVFGPINIFNNEIGCLNVFKTFDISQSQYPNFLISKIFQILYSFVQYLYYLIKLLVRFKACSKWIRLESTRPLLSMFIRSRFVYELHHCKAFLLYIS